MRIGYVKVDPYIEKVEARIVKSGGKKYIEFTAGDFVGTEGKPYCGHIDGKLCVVKRDSLGRVVPAEPEPCGEGYTCLEYDYPPYAECVSIRGLYPKPASLKAGQQCIELSKGEWLEMHYENFVLVSSVPCPYGCIGDKCVSAELYYEIQRILHGMPKIEIDPRRLPPLNNRSSTQTPSLTGTISSRLPATRAVSRRVPAPPTSAASRSAAGPAAYTSRIYTPSQVRARRLG